MSLWHMGNQVFQCIGCGTPVMLPPGTVSLGVPLHCPSYPTCSRAQQPRQVMGSTSQTAATPQYHHGPPRAYSAPPNFPRTVDYQTALYWQDTGAVTEERPPVAPQSLFPSDKYHYDLVESLLEGPFAESPSGPAAGEGHDPALVPLARAPGHAPGHGHGHEDGESVQPNQHAAAAAAAAMAAMYGHGMPGTSVPATMGHGNTGGGASGPDPNAFGRMMSMDPADDHVAPAPVRSATAWSAAVVASSSATGSMHSVPRASSDGAALLAAPTATATPANHVGTSQQNIPQDFDMANFSYFVRTMSLDEDTVTYDDSAIAGPRMTTNPSDAMAPSFRGANRVAGLGQTDKVLLPPLNIKEEEVLTKDEGGYAGHPRQPTRTRAADTVRSPSLPANGQMAVPTFGIRGGQPLAGLEEATPVASRQGVRRRATQQLKLEPEEDRGGNRNGIDTDLEKALHAVLIRDPKSTLQLTGNQDRRLELLHKNCRARGIDPVRVARLRQIQIETGRCTVMELLDAYECSRVANHKRRRKYMSGQVRLRLSHPDWNLPNMKDGQTLVCKICNASDPTPTSCDGEMPDKDKHYDLNRDNNPMAIRRNKLHLVPGVAPNPEILEILQKSAR